MSMSAYGWSPAWVAPTAPVVPQAAPPMPAPPPPLPAPVAPAPAAPAALSAPAAPAAPASPGWSADAPWPGLVAPTPAPTPVEPTKPARTLGALALVDLGQMLLHPIKTVKDLVGTVGDLIALNGQKNLTVATSGPAFVRYDAAKARLEGSTFKRILPFLDRMLGTWADGRVQELRSEVQTTLSQRAWHPIVLEWPVGGTGHQKLAELRAIAHANATATEGQMVRAFQGVNRVRFMDSTTMDYFYPLARSGDALLLRRNLPLIPGQKSVAEHLQGLLTQSAQVHVQIQ